MFGVVPFVGVILFCGVCFSPFLASLPQSRRVKESVLLFFFHDGSWVDDVLQVVSLFSLFASKDRTGKKKTRTCRNNVETSTSSVVCTLSYTHVEHAMQSTINLAHSP